MNERTIFLEALEQPTPERRDAFLGQACGENAPLRQKIDDLLRAHSDAGSFIEHSPAGTATTRMAGQPQSDTDDPTDQYVSNDPPAAHAEINLSFLSPSPNPKHLGRLGHYEILEVIGRGAFGIVLRALDPKLNRVVAIKVLLPELAANAMSVRRFLKEAQAAAAVSHDHVVTIHAVDDSNPLPFLVMECILGQSLQEKINRQGALPVDEILRIGMQTASGLAAAHKQGLVHRDIKPGNILLENSVQRVKITDFGLARSLDDLAATQTFQVAGTPQYMSPEQAQGATIDQRSDLFSLGSVLYTMCTGRAAFRADSIMAVLKRVCDDTPRPIHESNPEIPEWLCEIVDKLLEKKPEDRYQTAAEVAELLGKLLAEIQQQPSRAVPTAAVTTPKPVPARKAKKNRPPVAVVLLVIVFGLPLMAVVGWLGTRFYSSRDVPTNSSVSRTVITETEPPKTVVEQTGWPADAPPPAIAPFDAAQAKAHQEAWATYLKVPVEYTNSIGMKFVLIPPGEFLMGSTAEEIDTALIEAVGVDWWEERIRSEAPRHQVILTQPIYLGIHEVTQAQYEQVMGQNPSHFAPMGAGKDAVVGLDTTSHPVEMVSWNDSAEFCAKLSQQEQLQPFYFRSGETVTPLDGSGYRLPTEAEWEYSCRAGTTTRYWIGDKDEYLSLAGRQSNNSGGRTHLVGELLANPFGVYDIHGNVWEWVQDEWEPTYYGQIRGKTALDSKSSSSASSQHVLRGGWYDGPLSRCRAAYRHFPYPPGFALNIGFRVALPVDTVQQALKDKTAASLTNTGWPADAPKPAIAPFDAEQAKKHQEAWAAYLKVPVEYANSIGMKFRLIPPGEYLRGSPPEEIEAAIAMRGDDGWKTVCRGEGPRHRVVLTQPFYLGIYEVTQEDYEQLIGTNPSHFSPSGAGRKLVEGLTTKHFPVEMVSLFDATEFCTKLSRREHLQPHYFYNGEHVTDLSRGTGYRLPTEAEWEFACRSGTTTLYSNGDTTEDLLAADWFNANSEGRTHPVGELAANAFGLFDLHGNVEEWCADGADNSAYQKFQEQPAVNPWYPRLGKPTCIFRGGTYKSTAAACRSAFRNNTYPGGRDFLNGFRAVLSVEGVKQTLQQAQDPDRAAAEWVLSIGGRVRLLVDGVQRDVISIQKLPKPGFRVLVVDLGGNDKVDDDGLQALRGLTMLNNPILNETRITDRGLAILAEISSVVHLAVRGTRITDEGLAVLKKLPRLKNVALNGTAITDAGLESLAGCSQLKSMHVHNTKVTEAGVKKLAVALPKCQITWDGGVIEPLADR